MKDTKNKIISAAEDLIMTKGYNGFSYNDISEIIGIRKASIHYHFKTKSDLISAVLKQYHERFLEWCTDQNGKSVIKKIEAYGNLYKYLSAHGTKICPIEMLSAEYPALSKRAQRQLQAILREEKKWLIDVIESWKNNQKFARNINSEMIAVIIQTSMGGILNNIRIYKDNSLIDGIIGEIKKIVR